jgi:glycosyltransferase involved in cell wall biosynthesis
MAAAGIARKWVSFRYWQLTRARKSWRPNGWWNRAYTRFWQAVRGDRCWRRLQPGLWDYELAYGPVIDELAPDLIHANDFRMLGVGARAAIRARAAGRQVKLVWDAHEFLPGIRPWRNDARWLPANRAHEREYAPYADAVVTVSADLAELLRKEHGLAELPVVVLNAPARADATASAATGSATTTDVGAAADEAVPDLRDLCGVGPVDPLLVYSGAAADQRGLSTMVEALPRLPGVHVALVVNKTTTGFMRRLVARAAELGVTDRVHLLPYVPHWQVVRFLASADAGVIPIHHWPNHEIALITKFFEYSHARLPMIVSDVRTMSETVRSTGQGEVFRAQDLDDYVRAVQAVLADPARYRAAYEQPGLLAGWTWEAQAEVLDGVYRRLLPGRDGSTEAESVPAGRSTTTAGAAA